MDYILDTGSDHMLTRRLLFGEHVGRQQRRERRAMRRRWGMLSTLQPVAHTKGLGFRV